MCGICGFVGFKDDHRLTRMIESLVHTLTFARGQLSLRRYWTLKPDPEAAALDGEEAEERLLALEIWKRTCVEDRPV